MSDKNTVRGKRLDSGQWVKGYLVPFLGKAIILPSDANIGEFHGFPVDPKTVGKFSGQTDKNGEEIFEGDKVLVSVQRFGVGAGDFVVSYEHKPGIVEYGKGAFSVVWDDTQYGKSFLGYLEQGDIQVVGTIYDEEEADQPEQLKTGLKCGETAAPAWIYGDRYESEYGKKIKAVEEALGFRLFIWQKTFISRGDFRWGGFTTAKALRELLSDNPEPIDYRIPSKVAGEICERNELRKIKAKLDKAGIKTRDILERS